MDLAGVPIRPAGFALFLCECGWSGSDAVLHRVVQWLADQHISDRTALIELQLEDLVGMQQWPQEVTAHACASVHVGRMFAVFAGAGLSTSSHQESK